MKRLLLALLLIPLAGCCVDDHRHRPHWREAPHDAPRQAPVPPRDVARFNPVTDSLDPTKPQNFFNPLSLFYVNRLMQ